MRICRTRGGPVDAFEQRAGTALELAPSFTSNRLLPPETVWLRASRGGLRGLLVGSVGSIGVPRGPIGVLWNLWLLVILVGPRRVPRRVLDIIHRIRYLHPLIGRHGPPTEWASEQGCCLDSTAVAESTRSRAAVSAAVRSNCIIGCRLFAAVSSAQRCTADAQESGAARATACYFTAKVAHHSLACLLHAATAPWAHAWEDGARENPFEVYQNQHPGTRVLEYYLSTSRTQLL